MKAIYIKYISEYLQVKDWQVENCAALFEEGCTIPFISRYRKERTGGLDDEQVAGIRHWTDVFAEMAFGAGSLYTSYNWIQEQVKADARTAVRDRGLCQCQ